MELEDGWYCGELDGQRCPSGRGELLTGRQYSLGDFEEGALWGRACILNLDGEGFFDGEVRAGVPVEGVFKREGYVYKGPLQDGVPHGEGEEWIDSGDTFKGLFEYGRRVHGEYFWANHPQLRAYEGELNESGPSKCRLAYMNGDVFEGVCCDQQLVSGTYSYRNRDSYEGEFSDGLRDGHGRYLFANQNVVYDG